MLILSLCSKEYTTSILAPTITMTSMSATYYLIRLSMSGYTNVRIYLYLAIILIYQVVIGIIVGMILGIVIGMYLDKKEK